MRIVLQNIVVALAYFLFATETAAFLSAYGIFPAPFWPSASIGLAAALLGQHRLWAGIFLGSLLSNWLLFNAPFGLAVGISVTNVLGPAVGAALIRRFCHTPLPFFRVEHVTYFILFGALLHGVIVASGGVGQSLLAGTIPSTEAYGAWWRWALSDAGGTFLFSPALILWWHDREVALTPKERWEGSLLIICTLTFAVGLFYGISGANHPFMGLPYLLLAPLMWFTVRFSLRSGTTLLSLLALIAISATIAQRGPFHLAGGEGPLLGVGLMVVAFGISVLAVGALVSERRTAEMRLWELNETLEQRITERTVELHRRATEDGLTGVANRTYFFELGQFSMERARRTGRPLTALVVDLDDLKTINDTLGHHKGDAAITHVANACRNSLRDSDLVGRVGGDEFALLLSNVDIQGAQVVIDRIRDKLRNEPCDSLNIQASIGYAGLIESDTCLDDLLRRADAAMYEEKRRRSAKSAA